MKYLRVVLLILLLGFLANLRQPIQAGGSSTIFLPIVRLSVPMLAFTGDPYPLGNSDIFVAEASGAQARRVTSGLVDAYSPSWSPDGTRVAFATRESAGTGLFTSTISIVALYSADVVTVTTQVATDYIRDVHWSPDGTRFVFSSYSDQLAEIYTVQIDGSHLTRLTNNLVFDSEPTWSPDGTQLAFISDRDNDNREIYMMQADGSQQHRLTLTAAVEFTPAWSPDGTQLAFTRNYRSIYVRNLLTGSETPIFSEATDNYAATQVAWSPDGQQFAFTETMPRHNQIVVINRDGTPGVTFTNPPDVPYTSDPTWAPQ
jgi:tol-pal system beta propeller repeat protein TolB